MRIGINPGGTKTKLIALDDQGEERLRFRRPTSVGDYACTVALIADMVAQAECDKPAHGGRDNHVAMQVDDFDAIHARLKAADITCTMSKSSRAALFCRDPDGNTIELIQAQ